MCIRLLWIATLWKRAGYSVQARSLEWTALVIHPCARELLCCAAHARHAAAGVKLGGFKVHARSQRGRSMFGRTSNVHPMYQGLRLRSQAATTENERLDVGSAVVLGMHGTFWRRLAVGGREL